MARENVAVTVEVVLTPVARSPGAFDVTIGGAVPVVSPLVPLPGEPDWITSIAETTGSSAAPRRNEMSRMPSVTGTFVIVFTYAAFGPTVPQRSSPLMSGLVGVSRMSILNTREPTHGFVKNVSAARKRTSYVPLATGIA